eukprot:6099522-Alexandrium_andersonii.AAC.1
MSASLVGSEMCIRDSPGGGPNAPLMSAPPTKGGVLGAVSAVLFSEAFEDRGRGAQGCAIAAVLVGGPHDTRAQALA